MHSVCTYTSAYLPFYDDEYGGVHYDNDDDHASCHGHTCPRRVVHGCMKDDCDTLHDNQRFVDLRTSLWTTSSTMMGPWGANQLGIHARTCESCVGK